jgi:putative transcriptional regulator
LYWGGDFEVIKREISLGRIAASEIRFFLGYSGWDAGQLEEELKGDSWLVTDVEPGAVMGNLSENSWFDFVKKAGSRYSVWKNFPENPTLN